MTATIDTPSSPSSPLTRVWEPVDLGPHRLKNRIIVPARVLNYGVDGVISDRHLNVYRTLAEGGPAAIVTEQHAAHPTSKGSFSMPASAWEYRAIPQFEKFAQLVEDHDVKGFVQLFGTGVHDKGTMIMDSWHELWGVSNIPSFVHGEFPMVMEREHLQDLIKGFARAAGNVRSGGLHGVELHAAHAYLLGQFLSPAYNNRADEYGGSNQNRTRIIREIAEAVRGVLGSDMTLGVRLTYDEFLGPAGIQPEDAEEQIEILAGSGLFDYFSISGGGYHTLHMAVAPMGSVSEGYMVPFARRAKQVVADRAKVITVGRIRDLQKAEEVLTADSADLVAMGRAQLADPHHVRKTKEGREHEIIKCVGMNECIGRLFDQQEVVCAMNPATGREHMWGPGTLHPSPRPRSILVVGGGPAGMKFAAVAASRGHQVRLVERRHELGGSFLLNARLPGRSEWLLAIDNLVREMDNAAVTVELGVEADEEYLASAPESMLVLATGARYDTKGQSPFRPDRIGMPGSDQENVIDLKTAVERALDDPRSLGNKVIVCDETGAYPPLALSEVLAQAGVTVEIVTAKSSLGEDAMRQLDLPHVLPRLATLGVRRTAGHGIESIDASEVTVVDIWGGAPRVETDVDTLVMSMFRLPNDELFAARRSLRFDEVRRVGDCVAPRATSAVLYDAMKNGREV